MLDFEKNKIQSIFHAPKILSILSDYAGVGLWDAELHHGDPRHVKSRWRWSGEFRRLLGFNPKDTSNFPDLMTSWSDRLHPDDVYPTFTAFEACLNDRTGRIGYDVKYRLRMRNETYRWFRAIGGVLRDNNMMAIRACGSLIDVDEEVMSEKNRRETVQRFISTLENEISKIVLAANTSAQQVASASEELAVSSTQISSRISKISDFSQIASIEAENTNTVVQGLLTASECVADVLRIIEEIASKTNLLALNATIEASRAGDAGRGFAVVANEVKSLSQQTSGAIDNIAIQIHTLQVESKKMVDAIERIGNMIHSSKELTDEISHTVVQQESATREIARQINDVAMEIVSVSDKVNKVSDDLKKSD